MSRAGDTFDACPQLARPALVPVAVGIDSLYLSSFLDGVGIDWEALRFEQEKLRASPGTDFAEFDLGSERFALKRGGRKPYSFVLKNRAFELQLGERIQPRCYAQFSSELLWERGLDAALARYRVLWRDVGTAELRNEVITRIDTAFDFAIGTRDFEADHFVSRANKDSIHRKNRMPETFKFGRSDIVCRVYDKIAEIEDESGKTWFYDIWGVKEGVWRSEFQMRGPVLRVAGIATIEQCRAYLPGLVRHLSRSHTSLRVPNGDSNRSRWPLHPMWQGLIEAADRLVTPPLSPPPPLVHGANYLLDRQCQSLYGDLKGIAAVLSRNRPDAPITLEQVLNWLPGRLGRYHSAPLWKHDVADKIRKRELGL